MIAALFGSTKQNIGQHLKKIFVEGELLEISVVKKFFTTAADGKNYDTTFYNLDAIIACGYRINSVRATRPIGGTNPSTMSYSSTSCCMRKSTASHFDNEIQDL